MLFFSTGTGEAPHNAIVVDLLRKGHHGPIVSAVSVSRWANLGYVDKHRELQSRYPNYHYLPKVTGVVELLAQRGFALDHRNLLGNVQFEEYW